MKSKIIFLWLLLAMFIPGALAQNNAPGALAQRNAPSALAQRNALVLQSDFGLKDGAVAAMKGIAFGVDKTLAIFDLTHDIPPFDIWEAAYRLSQTSLYWPPGTVFVSVVDPGVGTARKSVVLKTQSGHFFVGPNNGTLTLVAEQLGIAAVREIDEARNRIAGSELSYTFHGRDVYAFVGARLASEQLAFNDVGSELPAQVKNIPHQKASLTDDGLAGTIPVLDIQYGNVWTNIHYDLLQQMGIAKNELVCVKIFHDNDQKYAGQMPYVNTFGDVPEGEPLVYINSLLNVSVALNLANFAQRYGIESGADWKITFSRCP